MATLSRTRLSSTTTYYWKVNSKDSKGVTTTSTVWSFATGSGVLPGIVAVAGGIFTAGSTPVTISSFKIGKYEVTYELWTELRNWALTHGYSIADILLNLSKYIKDAQTRKYLENVTATLISELSSDESPIYNNKSFIDDLTSLRQRLPLEILEMQKGKAIINDVIRP